MILDTKRILEYQQDWNLFIKEALGVRLVRHQRNMVRAVQDNTRVTVRSCHSFGKDYGAAAIALSFLYLYWPNSKVIHTSITDRQVVDIMMAEISRIWNNAKIPLGGDLQVKKIKFEDQPACFLEGFKTQDKKTEAWAGYHAPNLLLIITEASGIEKSTFDAIEGLLTGNSRLLLVGNPNRLTGEFYRSFKSPNYYKIKLSAFDSVNVRAKKDLIPGMTDYAWTKQHIKDWCKPIDESERNIESHDFKFEGQWYRPDDRCRVKVLGEFPMESEDKLIPMVWIEAARERWRERAKERIVGNLRLGVDVAGMGRNFTVMAPRYNNFIDPLKRYSHQDTMIIAGLVKGMLQGPQDCALIDTIGMGDGVHARLAEQGINSVSAKFSAAAKDHRGKPLTDMYGEYTFVNMRDYCYWAIRDALDPQLSIDLALPDDDELAEELNEITWHPKSDGRKKIDEKEEIVKRLGRSPDKADAVALSFFPIEERSNLTGSFSVRERQIVPKGDVMEKWNKAFRGY